MSRFFSTHRRTPSPSICLLSLAHHTLCFTSACTHTLTHWHWIMDEPCDTVMIHLSHLYILKKARPSLCHLEFTFCHLTFTKRLRTPLSADVSLLLTLNPHTLRTPAQTAPCPPPGGLEQSSTQHPYLGSTLRSSWGELPCLSACAQVKCTAK